MDPLLFSDRSLWTMAHGIVLGGGSLLGLAAALYALRTLPRYAPADPEAAGQARSLAWLLVGVATLLWLTVIVGTYVTFPPYRATPPEGTLDLARYPRSLIQSNPATVWLHAFGMEIKEHVPFITAMLATAVAFVSARFRTRLLTDAPLRGMATALVALCFALVAAVSLLGVFINKVAPLE